MPNHASGQAIKIASKIKIRNSFESIPAISATEAPSTFRTPFSLVRCAAEKVERPNSPRQAIIMAMTVK